MPAPSRAFEVGQCATDVPVTASRLTADSSRCTQCASHDVLAEPAEIVGELGRGPAERLPAVRVLLAGLGQVGVQPDAQPAGQLGHLAHELLADAERGARRHRHPHHGAGGGVVEPADRLGRRGQRVVRVLDDLVGRQPACRTAEVHRAPAGMKPHPDRRGGGDLRLERVPAAVPGRGRSRVSARRPRSPARREDVVVIGAGAAPGQGQPAQSGGGRRADVRGLDPGPDRIQLGEPVEQDGLLRAALGQPLVQVGGGY